MRTKIRWLAMLMVFGLVVAACGGDATTDTTEAPDDTAETTAAPDTAETTAAPDDTTETTAAPGGEIATDFGVDLEAGVIRIGMLSDLTGPFGPLVSAILAGTEAYWAQVNASGGVNGLQVELVVRDTLYEVPNHIALYGEIKDQVVAIGHSTGSPHTVAINADLQADGMFAIPLTWYSGWSDSAINSNLLSHGVSYCVESMNTIGYLLESDNPDATTIAIASLPGDYGLDSANGAVLAAEALGLTVIDAGIGAINPQDESTLTEVANAIVAADADIVWVATTPSTFSAIYGQALASGVETRWSGPSPSWNPAFVGPDSPIKDAIARDFIGGLPTTNWTADAMAPWREAFTAAGAPPTDYYAEGIVEAAIVHQALLAAYDSGDMTRAGVLAAAKGLDNVDFNGIAPSESYVGADNDRLQRAGYIFQPDPAGLADGSSAGSILLESEYTSQIAAEYEFTGACYVLE
jgi:ABC-type branched-subunit amino acid transport system substrate-binding protein